jgi:lysophospholipase L1-like esterase
MINFTGHEISTIDSQQSRVVILKTNLMKYLALGDSYTIGEQVPAEENFPNQVYLQLRDRGVNISQPRIIAVTGWTTAELKEGIQAAGVAESISTDYDLVTLLIGVNNQYRGLSIEEYEKEFEELLAKSIHFAGDEASRVIVLSIPDWGVTPFAEGRDRALIRKEIDQFNSVNKTIAIKRGTYYIDITPWTREAGNDAGLLAPDRLHPSGREYRRWAGSITSLVMNHFTAVKLG